MPNKTCPQCSSACGPRRLICQNCGYDFQAKYKPVPKPPVKEPEPEPAPPQRSKEGIFGYSNVILTPGTGMPGAASVSLIPVKPKAITAEAFTDWINGLQDHAANRRSQYHPVALKYMLRQLWREDTPEYAEASAVLNSVLPDVFPEIYGEDCDI